MATSSPSTTNVTPQQIGKAFVVQYYRLLHEHPESLHRFFSASSTFMHDDLTKTVTGIEAIAKRIEELSLKQRHVKIHQVGCHLTVGSSIVIQVCGEISSTPVTGTQTQPIMKRFVQTFVLTRADNSKQKYYVHNDILRYQDSPTTILTNDNNTRTSPTITNNNEVSNELKSMFMGLNDQLKNNLDGFNKTLKGFKGQLDTNFTSVNKNIRKLEKKFNKRFDQLSYKIDDIYERGAILAIINRLRADHELDIQHLPSNHMFNSNYSKKSQIFFNNFAKYLHKTYSNIWTEQYQPILVSLQPQQIQFDILGFALEATPTERPTIQSPNIITANSTSSHTNRGVNFAFRS
ncbi:unnamed protein product [Rotaria sordida]|uniref:NTF2 domain-containing protein n=1 Tax=Rotaria sordida TaxID=392033 RepID=A0A818W5V0_9BILA|nr:unnamed protein product [Rotaria sordida]CAF3720615.1 unnamed protein product [Rotaria sordida]